MRSVTYRFLLLVIMVLSIVGCGGGGGGGGGDNTDTTSPTVNSFTLPATATSLTVPVTGLSASDNVGVIGYLISESATKPTASAVGWSATAPTSFTFSSAGARTAYAWAKDAAGNVSANLMAATVTMHIAAISTVLTTPTATAVSTVSISGISNPLICGIDLRVTYPIGTSFVSVVASGVAQGSLISEGEVFVSETTIAIARIPGFASGEIAKINYATVPLGSVPENFGVEILKEYDCPPT